ncbi:hypothetical protein BH20PSE1_BH20PSE1_09870 [soil metagenome]
MNVLQVTLDRRTVVGPRNPSEEIIGGKGHTAGYGVRRILFREYRHDGYR